MCLPLLYYVSRLIVASGAEEAVHVCFKTATVLYEL